MRRIRFGLALGFALAGVSSANAQAHLGRVERVRWDLHADFAYTVGVGFRADIPVIKEGLLSTVNDDLSISPGVEVFFFDYDETFIGVWPLFALQWNFYVGRRGSVFPEIGVVAGWTRGYRGYYGGVPRPHNYDPDDDHFFVWPFLSFGGRYHFSDKNALLLRVSWPAGLQVGITF